MPEEMAVLIGAAAIEGTAMDGLPVVSDWAGVLTY